jgi:hypothetical protein
MSEGQPIIPLCNADFLQDFSIEFGRQLKPIWSAVKSVIAEADHCESEGQSFERLSVWIYTWNYTSVALTLWEDQTVRVSVSLLTAEKEPEFEISFDPECNHLASAEIVEALRNTVSVSTRLCYSESPLPMLRRIWRHKGKVETKGKLAVRRKA